MPALQKEKERFTLSSIPRQLLLQIILILLNAFFAAAEIAVVSLNTTKLRRQEEEGDKKAGKLLKLVEEPASFLSTIQVGITLAGFLGSAFAADNFSEYLVRWIYDDIGFRGLPEKALDTISVIIITIILSYFTLIFGELVPKRIAMQKSMEVAKFSSGVISGVAVVMRPVIWFLSFSTNTVLRILHMKTEAEEESVTEEEIRMMVDIGEEKGAIEPTEKMFIENIFEFNNITAEDVMIHRTDMKVVWLDDSKEEIMQLITDSGLSRFPVCGDDIDDVIGLLRTREYLLNAQSEQPRPLRDLLAPVYFVPESVPADKLFRDMQQKKIHMAIVVDEYGQTSGIVTMEDILEELVGEIWDEHDEVEQPFQKMDENTYHVLGSADPEEMFDRFGLSCATDASTVGGWVMEQLRRVPQAGDSFCYSGWEAMVLKADGRHVLEIEMKRIHRAKAANA